jgi:Ribose/xylose/arabinose/galactoside ABC-type transport systems, permease components
MLNPTDPGDSTGRVSTRGKMSNESFITLSMMGVFLGLFALACILVPNFYRGQNIVNLVTNYWFVIMLGIGVTFLLITGNFDMSVGGIVAMTGVLSVYFCQAANVSQSELANGLGLPYGVAIALALVAALLIGAINAFFVTKLKVASIIVTLGTMSISRGIAQIVTQGAQRNTSLPDIFSKIGNITVVSSIKLAVIIMVVFVIAAVVIEKRTVFGRRTYLIGANKEASRLSGVKVGQHVTILYLTSALLAGITGILLASEYISGTSNRVMGSEFDALVIVLLGGTSIAGGFGSVSGTVIGAIILAVVTSSATGMLLRPEWQFILKGAVTFLAIMAQRFALDRRKL